MLIFFLLKLSHSSFVPSDLHNEGFYVREGSHEG